jgi:7-cyano-7-deazaguanine synthase in queuosine biosynthesis
MKWHVIAKVGTEDNYIPNIEADAPRLFVTFDSPDDPFRMREHVLSNLHKCYGRLPSSVVTDLLYLAMATYAADMSIKRSITDDDWTREITIHVPVTDPQLWINASEIVTKMISFLTGDKWSIEFRERIDTANPEPIQVEAFLPTKVSLFSGGMDSLIGALDLLAGEDKIAFVGHYGGGKTKTFQDKIVNKISEVYPGRFNIHRIHVLPPLIIAKKGETTMRSRSILFIALGLAVADVCGEGVPLNIPENGLISLNVPLTGARDGSASTRTTHPYFISLFRELLIELNINHPLNLPYKFMTKGEMLRQVTNQQLLARIVPLSMSCAHPEAERWHGGASNQHCGYCFPCIIRQASSYAANLEDGAMSVDIVNHPPDYNAKKGHDLRAVKISLARIRNRSLNRVVFDVLDSGPIPPEELQSYVDVYRRGMEEVSAFIRSGR